MSNTFAVDPAQRNGGHGKNVLNHLCQLLQHPIVLEVEMPEEEMAQRRINFYKRQGFVPSGKNHIFNLHTDLQG